MKVVNHEFSGDVRKGILIVLITLYLCSNGMVLATSMTFGYTGVATYDNQPATMNLVITGTTVTGTLTKPGICESNIRLTNTNLALTGTLTGGWEGTGTITGTWTGGDTVCGNQLTIADGYPVAGTFTITTQGNTVRLLRTGAAPLPSGWTYDFGATGNVYQPGSSENTATQILNIWTLGTVYNQPTSDTTLHLEKDTKITKILTYHWNDGKGTDTPGQIMIVGPSQTYTFSARGEPGMGGVPNAYWIVEPNQVLTPGTYRIQVSDESSWSQNSETGGKGVTQVWGIEENTSGNNILQDLSYSPSSPTVDNDIGFTLKVSNPPADPSYEWDMGEAFFAGQPVAWVGIPSFTYSYSKPGVYHVTVSVRDKQNYSTILDKKSWDVTVT